MKRISLTLVLMILTLVGFSQDQYLDNFFSKYQKNGGINISMDSPGPWLSGILSNDKDAQSFAKKITGFHMMMLDKTDNPALESDLAELNRNLSKENFDELVSVKKSDNRVSLLARDAGNYISDMFLVVTGSDHVILVQLQGKLSYDDLHKIESSVKDTNRHQKTGSDDADN